MWWAQLFPPSTFFIFLHTPNSSSSSFLLILSHSPSFPSYDSMAWFLSCQLSPLPVTWYLAGPHTMPAFAFLPLSTPHFSSFLLISHCFSSFLFLPIHSSSLLLIPHHSSLFLFSHELRSQNLLVCANFIHFLQVCLFIPLVLPLSSPFLLYIIYQPPSFFLFPPHFSSFLLFPPQPGTLCSHRQRTVLAIILPLWWSNAKVHPVPKYQSAV